MTASLMVSLHDVAPATHRESHEWLERLDRLDVSASLLVIPGPWRGTRLADADDAFLEMIQAQAQLGNEIVAHGWTHTADITGTGARYAVGSLVARGAAEFWALDAGEAYARATAARTTLAHAGVPAAGFVAPGWMMSRAAVHGVEAAGYLYTTTHFGLVDFSRRRLMSAFAYSHRPDSRAATVGARLMEAGSGYGGRRGKDVRIAIHPADLSDRRLVEATERSIREALSHGLVSRTYSQRLECA